MQRCINLDWLEVHALEPDAMNNPRDPDYFRNLGWQVNERDYGTRVFRQMFTLIDHNGHPFIEVRRFPLSPILHVNSCHIRLHNRTCYFDNAAHIMQCFLSTHGFVFMRIVRVDICLDFEYFDSKDNPADFLRRYMSGKYSKINQANIRAYGTDTWSAREWNSLSWGAPTSDIGTKFYDKTAELYDPISNTYGKPYIRQAWLMCGLIDDMQACTRTDGDGKVYKPRIWRVEFSIRSSVKKWFVIELNGKQKAYQSIRNTLDMYDGREHLLTIFASLQRHYFYFKHFQEGKRKDRCSDKVLFFFDNLQFYYKLDKAPTAGHQKANADIVRLLNKLRNWTNTKMDKNIHEAAQVIMEVLHNDIRRSELDNPFSHEELLALRLVMADKMRGNNKNASVLLREIKELLKLNDKTLIF